MSRQEPREQIKRYTFEYDEITCCSDCPFFYDYIYCEIDERPKQYKQYTWSEDGHRPDWCPIKEGIGKQYVTVEITMESGGEYGISAEGTTQKEILKNLLNSFVHVVLNEKTFGAETISIKRVSHIIIR